MCHVEVLTTRQLYHVSLALVMGFIIVTRTVEGSDISRSRFPISAGDAGNNEILSIKKRSPVRPFPKPCNAMILVRESILD